MTDTAPQRPLAGEEGREVDVLREQLNSLQVALQSSEHAVSDFRRRAESDFWSLGPLPQSPFAQNLPCLAFMKDSQGRYLYVNELWEKVFNKKPGDWLNRTDLEMWGPSVSGAFRCHDLEVLQGSASLQSIDTLPGTDGQQFWLVTKFPVTRPLSSEVMIGGVAIDVTERRLAEQALEFSEQRYRDLFNSVLTGIYRMTPDGRIEQANPAILAMLDFPDLEALASGPLQHCLRSRSQQPSEFSRAMDRDGFIFGYENVWPKRDGTLVHVRESSKAVRAPSGEIQYYEGVVENITGRKRAQLLERDCNHLLECVAKNEPLELVLNELVLLLERQRPGRACVIMLLREGKLHLGAGPSLPADHASSLSAGVELKPGLGSCGDAAYFGKPSIIAQLPLGHPYKSSWSLPILSGSKTVLGTLDVYTAEEQSPDPQDMELLQMTSRLAGVAVEHRNLYTDLARQANYDPLTGLPNRSLLHELLEEALTQARWKQLMLGLLWVDLDRFKEVNDTLGHRIGDVLLQQVAARISSSLLPGETLGRMGGDEFAILLPVLKNLPAAENCAARVLEALKKPFHVEGYEFFMTASVGISAYPEHGLDSASLEGNADSAMYSAKSRGRNLAVWYEAKLNVGARERLELEGNLRKALEHKELELFYQPQVGLSGTLHGFEALIRWNHPRHGLLSPAQFISIAEDSGLIVPIGSWVVQQACRQAVTWQQTGLAPVKIAINVSALQFYYNDYAEVVRQALVESGLEPKYLEVELTESLLMRNSDEAARQMDKLRSLGVSVAIDDFGTGYSSLSYLQRLPVDTLKIDRSFAQQMTLDSNNAVVQAITFLAHSLSLSVVMEGIEREDQMRAVRKLGIDVAQGYLIGRPMPADACGQFFDRFCAEKRLSA